MMRWRVSFGWWLLVLTGLTVLTVGLAVLMGDSLRWPVDPVGFLVSQVLLLAINFLVTNLWEEAAWAGFVQTRWERRHNLLVASLLTAVIFALGHLPLALFDDVTVASLAVSFLLYLTLGVLVRPLFALVLRGAACSSSPCCTASSTGRTTPTGSPPPSSRGRPEGSPCSSRSLHLSRSSPWRSGGATDRAHRESRDGPPPRCTGVNRGGGLDRPYGQRPPPDTTPKGGRVGRIAAAKPGVGDAVAVGVWTCAYRRPGQAASASSPRASPWGLLRAGVVVQLDLGGR
jgi:CAAX prenyl protease-like protein